MKCNKCGYDWSNSGDSAHVCGPVKVKQPEQEPVAWPCLIDSADFSENTITLVMQCKDYKVSAGTHWLSTTPPQRTWVGLTGEDVVKAYDDYQSGRFSAGFMGATRSIEAKLKQKNGFAEEKNA